MEGATGKNCGACSSTEVHNLFCELLDESTTYARALAIREHIAQCDFCQQRLEREELVRSLVRNCCAGQAKAPPYLGRNYGDRIPLVRSALQSYENLWRLLGSWGAEISCLDLNLDIAKARLGSAEMHCQLSRALCLLYVMRQDACRD